MATLREIQLCQLNILKEVAKICDKHEIPYYIAYGTLLGAVRHQGFIPWDDDIDIYMEYNDLKRFKKICKKELPSTLFYQDVETDPSKSCMFTKIRANNTLMKEKEAVYHQGIWIDIFPIIKVAEEKDFTLQLQAIKGYQNALANIVDMSKQKSKSLKHWLLTLYSNIKYKRLAKKSKKKFEGLQAADSGYYLPLGNQFWTNDKAEILKSVQKQLLKADWLVMEKYTFEDTTFAGIKDYNEYLTKQYGPDYMTPKKWAHIEDYSDVQINLSSDR